MHTRTKISRNVLERTEDRLIGLDLIGVVSTLFSCNNPKQRKMCDDLDDEWWTEDKIRAGLEFNSRA